MKKEMTLLVSERNTEMVNMMKCAVVKPLLLLSKYYTKLLDEKVSVHQTLLLINAQLAFFFTVFPVDCPLLARLICLVWLISALLKCKNSGLRTSD